MNIIKRKQTLWYKNLSLKWQCPQLVNEYKEINKQIPKLTRKTVRNYEENLANGKKNPKKLFAYVNSRQKVKTSINSLVVSEKTITSELDIVNALNNQFQSVFVNDSENSTLPDFAIRTKERISDISFNSGKVLEYLKKINPEKCQGSDKIHPFVIKKCANTLSKPISLIFQKSFENGELSDLWLEANVIPLFKKRK